MSKLTILVIAGLILQLAPIVALAICVLAVRREQKTARKHTMDELTN